MPLHNSQLPLYGLSLALLPAYLRNDTGPRAYQGSARVLGQLFFVSAIFFYCGYLESREAINYLPAVMSAAFIFLSSTFGSQVFVFTSLIIAFLFSLKYLLFVAASFALFYLLTLGKANQMIRARAGHYKWFFKFYQRIYYQKWGFLRNPIRDYAGRVKHWTTLIFKGKLKEAVGYILTVNNPLHIFTTCYFIYVALLYFHPQNETEQFIRIVTIGCLCIFVLTMLKPLLFLGESYRYLEFGAPIALILFFSTFGMQNWFNWFIPVWLGISFLQYIFYQIYFFKSNKKENDNYDNYLTFFKEVNEKVDGNAIASIHFRTKAAYFGNFSYLGNRGLIDLKHLSLEDNYLAFGNYPYPDGNSMKLIERFNVTYWITTDADLQDYHRYSTQPGELKEGLVPVVTNSAIGSSLYKVKNLA